MTPGAIAPTGLNYKALSASGLVKTGAGDCALMQVSSSSSLVVKLWDGVAASGTVILNSMAVDAKEEHDVPAHFNTGLYVEFVSGTGAVTIYFI